MPPHAIAYVQRKRITDWKRLVLTHTTPAFVYGSNDSRVFAKLPKGSILWIVSSIPGRSPELVARLEVAKVRCRQCPELGVNENLLRHFKEFKWIATGTSNSRFFGYNDAGPALMKTVFERTTGETWRLPNPAGGWQSRYGSLLQRPTLLHITITGKAGRRPLSPLEKLAASADHSVFISWKWKDHVKSVPLNLAHALAEQGVMVWLDHLALPDSRALKKIQKDKDRLERLLRYGYRQCKYLLAIDSKNYGNASPGSAKNWTLREWNGSIAPRARLDRICFRPSGTHESRHIDTGTTRLRSHGSEAAAKEFARLVLQDKI